MKALFADTSFFLAFLNESEEMHARAVGYLLSDAAIVTTEFVLIELGNAMSRGDAHEEYASLVETLSESRKARVIPASSEYFHKGVHLMRSRPDKDWSVVDCISFEVMRELKLEEALTTGKHFEQAGFKGLLR